METKRPQKRGGGTNVFWQDTEKASQTAKWGKSGKPKVPKGGKPCRKQKKRNKEKV